MLSHSFDRFYMVTKFELPEIEDLHLTTVQFDSTCSYLNTGKDRNNFSSSYLPKLLAYCENIVPYLNFYKKQIAYYNCTAYEMLANEIGLILPTFPRNKGHKRGIITSLVIGFISLAYEGISSFLHHKCQKALCGFQYNCSYLSNKLICCQEFSFFSGVVLIPLIVMPQVLLHIGLSA